MNRSILFCLVHIFALISTTLPANVPVVNDESERGITTTGFPRITEITVEEEVELVRQCSCKEKDECVEKLQKYTDTCNGECASILKKIGDPEKLKKCIVAQKGFGESLTECIQDKTGKACYDGTGEPPRIPKLDVTEKIDSELNRTVKLGKIFGNNPLLNGLAEVLDVMREYSSCMKTCVGENTKDGDCFTTNGCQLKKPSIDELKSAAFQCVSTEDRGHIADTCNCITEAGVTALTPICRILHLFAEKAEGFRTIASAARQD
uniref:Uncharacterized protein n=1 Tax=Plectus sambesii TaxID=2011161 RepID=A0A914WTB3_9BILA